MSDYEEWVLLRDTVRRELDRYERARDERDAPTQVDAADMLSYCGAELRKLAEARR